MSWKRGRRRRGEKWMRLMYSCISMSIERYSTLRAKTGKMEEPVNRELNVTRS